MTDFSKTITNSIRTFGIGPATQWGTGMTWGSTKWGEGSTPTTLIKTTVQGVSNTIGSSSEVPVKYVQKLLANTQGTTSVLHRTTTKLLSNSQGSTSALYRYSTKVLDNAQASTSDVSKGVTMGYTTTMVCSGTLESLKIYDAAGYCDNFPGSRQNGIDRIWDNWTSLTSSTDGFTEATDAATTWSDA